MQAKIYPQFSNVFLPPNSQLLVQLSRLLCIKFLNYSSSNPFNLFCSPLSFSMLIAIPTRDTNKPREAANVTYMFLPEFTPYSHVLPVIAKKAISFLFTIFAFLSIKSILSFYYILNYTIKKGQK